MAGATQTAILPGGPGAIVRFVGGEGPGAELEGFTLSSGSSPAEGGVCGGAIRIVNASPLIRGNIIRGNSAVLGGGVCLNGGAARLLDNVIELNTAELGGGVHALGGAPLLENNRFVANQAQGAGFGGGLSLEAAAATVRGNVFLANSARFGGAVSCRWEGESPVIFQRNSLAANGAEAGAGFYFLQGTPLVEACVVAFSSTGGAFWCNQAAPRLGCNVLHGNAGGEDLCGLDLGGNLLQNPLFCDLGEGDLRLSPGSPAWSTACGVAGAFAVDCDGVSVDGRVLPQRPAGPWLAPAQPNPFNPGTLLRWTLPVAGPATLSIHNLAGERVALLLEADLPAGSHHLTFIAEGRLASGLYLAVLDAGERRTVRPLLLLR
jgi:hypothetical protein